MLEPWLEHTVVPAEEGWRASGLLKLRPLLDGPKMLER